MLIYSVEDMKLFVDDCEEIVSFIIGPINKKHYEIICYVKNNEFRMLYSENDIKGLLDFINSHYPKNIPFSEMKEKICKESNFVNAYKNRFMKDVDVSLLKEKILSVKDFKSNGKEYKSCKGLDGFSMDCNIFSTNETFDIYILSYGRDYQEIIDLANSLLDYIGAERTDRFIIVDE